MQKNLFGSKIEKNSRLNTLTTDESTQLKAERNRRSDLVYALWDLLGSNVPRFCHLVRASVYKLSEKEFATKIGVKPVIVKKIETGNTSVAEHVEIALLGFMHLYRTEGDIELLEREIEFLKQQNSESILQTQLVNELLEHLDSSSRNISSFVRSLTYKYRLHKEEVAFVMDKTPEELEKLLTGECTDNRRLFGEIAFKIDEFAKRLATAIVDPMYEKEGGEGGLTPDTGSGECSPNCEISTKAVASGCGEVAVS